MDVRRVPPEEDDNDVASEQMRALFARLAIRDDTPLFVCDAGYDPVKLQKQLEGSGARWCGCTKTGSSTPTRPECPEASGKTAASWGEARPARARDPARADVQAPLQR